MSRALFLQRLRQGLSGLPPEEVEEIVSDYEFHFAEAGDAGKSEEETAAELGDPVRIAREIASQRNLGSARRGGAAGMRRRIPLLLLLLAAAAALLVVYLSVLPRVSRDGSLLVAQGQALKLGRIDRDTLDLTVMGGGFVSAEGDVRRAVVTIHGGGKAELGDLKVQILRLRLLGGGEIAIAPQEEADIAISGSGLVRLTSRPRRLNRSVQGSGRIELPR